MLAAHSKQKMAISHSPVPAGQAYELDEGRGLLDINELICRNHTEVRALEVTGSSMVPEIANGSIVFVNPAKVPENGALVAVCVNGKTSVKRLEIKPGKLYLVPSNKDYEKTEVTAADTVYVLGVIVGALQLFQ